MNAFYAPRAAAALLLGVYAGIWPSWEAGAQQLDSYLIAVDVRLVVLRASVRDRKGRLVQGLGEQDFAVFEDGVPQAIRSFEFEDAPVTVGLVVDHSGSMRPKLAEVLAGARAFVRNSKPEDEMFVVNFNEDVVFGVPAGVAFSHQADEIAQAISNTPATGMTALYDAVAKAIEHAGNASHENRVLLVISDGGDNASVRGLDDVLQMAERSEIMIYTIGLADADDPDRNPSVLRRMTRLTGGESYFPERLDEVVAVCERIAHDIRNRYTIGYVSSNVSAGDAYRAIRVTAQGAGRGKLSVRTREGYTPAGASPAHEGQDRTP